MKSLIDDTTVVLLSGSGKTMIVKLITNFNDAIPSDNTSYNTD